MTLAQIQTYIYRRSGSNATSFPNADMVVLLNTANEHVLSLIRGLLDTFTPTAWTTSDLTTGTATPVFDSLFHELIPLWAVYYYTNDKIIRSNVANEITAKEKELTRFYGMRLFKPVTVTIATSLLTLVGNDLCYGDQVLLSTTGALPTGLSVGTYYYILNTFLDGTFQVAATPGGTAITTSGSQSGTHYLSKIAAPKLTTKGINYF